MTRKVFFGTGNKHINDEEIGLSRKNSEITGAFMEEFWYNERRIEIKQIK